MKTVIATLLVVATLLLAGLAVAGSSPKSDLLGIYSDQHAEMSCFPMSYYDVYDIITAYVILTGLTSDSIGGWEAKLWFEGGVQLIQARPRGQYINAATRQDEYIIGLGTPLMVDSEGLIIILEMDLLILSLQETVLGYADAIYFHTLEEAVPAYLDGSDYEIIKGLNLNYMTPGDWVAYGALSCSTANESMSFEGVKSLYR